MHEHEVPTHVQAEDRVLLWFTFPQPIGSLGLNEVRCPETTGRAICCSRENSERPSTNG